MLRLSQHETALRFSCFSTNRPLISEGPVSQFDYTFLLSSLRYENPGRALRIRINLIANLGF